MAAVAGVLSFRANGEPIVLKGHATYSLGGPQREPILGPNGVLGYKEQPRVPFIEFATMDAQGLDLAALQSIKDASLTLSLRNGKVISYRDAWAAGDWQVNTEEGEIGARFEALSAVEN